MTISNQTIKEIASLGSGLIINAGNLSHDRLKEITSCVCRGKGYITLKNVTNISHDTLKEIASLGKGHVIFDLTD